MVINIPYTNSWTWTCISSVNSCCATTYTKNKIIGASLSEPHTSGSLVWSSRIRTSTKKSRPFPYLAGMLFHVTKVNEHSLVTILLFFIRSFVLRTITSDFHLVSIFGCMVIHVMDNKWIEITNAPYLVVRSFMSRRINKLRLLMLHIWLYGRSCHEE